MVVPSEYLETVIVKRREARLMQHHRAYDLALLGMVAALDDAEPERAAVERRTPPAVPGPAD